MKVCMLCFGAIDYSIALTEVLSRYCEIDFYYSGYHLSRMDLSILEILGNNVKTFCFGKYRIRDIRNVFVYHRLCKEIKNRNYDIIHFQEYGPPWVALFWKMCKKMPLIMTVHDPYQHPGIPFNQKVYQDIMQRIFIHKAKKIIVHSNLLKEQFLERYHRKANEDVVMIPHGDITIYKHWDKKITINKEISSTKNILFFGTVRPNKGLEYLLKAEPIIRNRINNYKIIIAGKFDAIEKYRKYIEPGARIKIINEFISNRDVPKYFRNASIVVLPYVSATQTGIIPLAYSFGKPVVATRVGAIPEIVDKGKTGILVEPRNVKALANAIIRLISNDDLIKKMSLNALKYSKKKLSWNFIAKKTIKIYNDLI